MYRLGIFSFLLISLVFVSSANAVAAPMISISVYATVLEDSPLHIVGLHYGEHGVQFVLSNASDKTVVRTVLVAVQVAPHGCAPNKDGMTIGSQYLHQLLIGPHEKAVT